jgi:hypothetical protein
VFFGERERERKREREQEDEREGERELDLVDFLISFSSFTRSSIDILKFSKYSYNPSVISSFKNKLPNQ